ncbi:hypothetical protein N0V93_001092 [Gnomoniopsis smithogilvyi]|uniref:Uncharacterized protein n=1 Tax=Gnomoniopsis smithogilvyi TaxID=1191159 RepID=A0A9W8Z330_9PEZI|nr:hypothetical protein N0V93_001092 [Gnomoniopsis smithogilvyi]
MSSASNIALLVAFVALCLTTGDCLRPPMELARVDCSGIKYVENSTVTFYGGPDNDPPWNDATAYSCDPARGFHAGGTGSYDDPLSFATADGEYDECEIVYSPYVKKYLRRDDFCATCNAPHIDIWTGSSITNRHGEKQIKCEEHMTPDQGQRVIRNPPKNLPVSTKPLWDGFKCHTNRVHPGAKGPHCSKH